MQRRKSIQASLSSVNLSWISFPSVTAIVVKEHKRSFAPLQSVLHVQLSLQTIIENPQKMTARKFYGCHFHCMIVHAPQTHRIFCLRSLLQELEERSFCDLRRISLNISNQQCGKVIENAILGFNTQQQTDRGESYRKQETIISQQAKLLPQSEDTKFSLEI